MSQARWADDRVLIPTGHDAASYVCVRSLADRGVEAVVASDKDGVPAGASRYCADSATLPPPREDLVAYRDALLSLAERPSVRTVIPVRPEDCYVLSRYREAFEEHVSLPVPSLDQLTAVQDRLRLAEVAEAAGVPVPETRALSEVDDWDGERIVKSRYNVLADAYMPELGPSEIDVVKDIRHVEPGEVPDADAIRTEMGHDPVVQEFVPYDDEYMFAGIYDHGEPLSTFQHRQIRGTSYTGGGGVYRRSVYVPELERVARDLLSELDWHGLACIEYMHDAETGEFVLTEINPRMWQSLPSTVRAGVDFPYHYWLLATGRADEVDPGYDLGVGSHFLHGEIEYLASVLHEDSPLIERPSVAGSLWAVAVSILTEPHFDYFALDDPGPFFRGVLNALPVEV
ncbi:carboxylate--amine ligase [Halomicrobium salinisoli]|uniref:carboxylate--amine ligase n=1 Tax=Halomicrobium salinisoli TaxID=2878391 RepID=UPI001CF0129F|nr:carboxylate--amine ligase [Halomicrobium salinisoli]